MALGRPGVDDVLGTADVLEGAGTKSPDAAVTGRPRAVLTGPLLPAPRYRAGGCPTSSRPGTSSCMPTPRPASLTGTGLPGRRPGDPGAPHRRGPGVLDPGPDDGAPARRRAVRCGGHGRVHPVSLQSGGDPRVVRGLPRHRDRRPGRRRRIRRARRPLDGAGPRPVGAEGLAGRRYGVLDVWRQNAATVTGRALPCGHYLPEQAPAQTTEASSPSSPVSSYGA